MKSKEIIDKIEFIIKASSSDKLAYDTAKLIYEDVIEKELENAYGEGYNSGFEYGRGIYDD